MEIGTSKKTGLFSNFVGLNQDQRIGPVNTRRFWKDEENRPLITSDIPTGVEEALKPHSYNTFSEMGHSLKREVTSRTKDVARISKLITHPNGVKWLSNQASLQMLQSELDTKYLGKAKASGLKAIAKNLLNSVINSATLSASTLAQVAVAGTGVHQTPFISRAYLVKGGKASVLGEILAKVGVGSGNYVNGANLAMNGAKIGGIPARSVISSMKPSKVEWSEPTKSPFTRLPETELEAVKVEPSGSYYKTVRKGSESSVFPTSHTEDTENIYDPASSVRQWSGRDRSEFSDQQGSLNGGDSYRLTKQFYSSSAKKTTYEGYLESRDPDLITVQNRIRGKVSGEGISDARLGGQEVKLRDKWSNGVIYETVNTPSSADIQFYWPEDKHREVGLIPFEISAITPETRHYMVFEANLSSYSDNFSGNWSSTNYVGRADNFYVYTGFDRQIDFSFKVFASRSEYLNNLYRKLNVLVGTTAPTYAGGNFMRGTLSSVSIGDYLVDQKGIFKSVKLSWKEDYMWELESSVLRVPLVLDVSINFIPIHDFAPESVGLNHKQLYYFGGKESKSTAGETSLPEIVVQGDGVESGPKPVLKLPGKTQSTLGELEENNGNYIYV